ncbi:HK97 gp10 family phage protein [Patescibacteria group bacterium]|nr:HK97 gp10 family phage protein [Patescibacteria group bacterium]
MAGNFYIELNLDGLKSGVERLTRLTRLKSGEAVEKIANEVLRLSQGEVPLDTGALQSSGHVEKGDNEQERLVGYNKVYASRLHENPQYNFKNGRKGKYLEDPLKNNLNIFKNIYTNLVGDIFK